jgi:Tfp pilus assembly protein PilF
VGRNVAVAAAVAAVFSLTFVAYRQTSLWRNSETLYAHTLSFTENNHFLMSNLCLHYLKRADVVTADRRCSELLGAMPPSVDAFEILGYLKMETGKYEESVRLYQEAVRLNPGSGQLRLQLSQAVARQGNPLEAEQMMQRAVTMGDPRVGPDAIARASTILAAAYLKAGRKDKAVEYYQKALSLTPDLAEAREALEKLEVK